MYLNSIRYCAFSLILSFCLFVQTGIYAQTVLGARALAMGQAVTALPDDDWSVFGNPAMLNQQNLGFAFYGVRNYGFSELTDYSAAFSAGHSYGISALGFHRYGDDLFNETRFRLAHKYEYENVHAAFVLNYNHVGFGGSYENSSNGVIGIDLAIATQLNDALWFGARTTNINQPSYEFDENLPRELAIGFSYQMTADFLVAMDVVKDVRFPVSYRTGLEYQIVENLFTRVGASTEPVTYSLGFGFSSDYWKFDFAVQQHSVLGLSPGIGFKRNLR